jgi:pimeloyl-[acyl-carrier protein] methyl ester esterase
MKLVLLPGMDGTGDLFAALVAALSRTIDAVIVRFPTDECLSYSQLAQIVQSVIPSSEPYVLLGESFSTPLAIQTAVTNIEELRGVILCAGFASSPVTGWLRSVYYSLAPIVSRITLPAILLRYFLVGTDAPSSLVRDVKAAVSSVRPKVLSDRLRSVLACDVRSELSKLKIPILYLSAEQDRVIQGASLDEILKLRPEMIVATIAAPHLLLQH